jgi:hypothetical protein
LGEQEKSKESEWDRRNGTAWRALTHECGVNANDEDLRVRDNRRQANAEQRNRDVEALQVESEECTSSHGEEPIATARSVPLTACDEPEERKRYRPAKEGDNGGCAA